MAPKSRAEIELAQTLTHYPIGGELLSRTRYGDECFGWRSDMAPCHDCGVTKGQLHIPCCELEECSNYRTQLFSCDCDLGPVRWIRYGIAPLTHSLRTFRDIVRLDKPCVRTKKPAAAFLSMSEGAVKSSDTNIQNFRSLRTPVS